MRWRRDDDGAAVVEFVVVGVALLIPLAYLIAAAASVNSAVFASTQAVREAGRAFTLSHDPAIGLQRAQAAAQAAFADQGMALPGRALTIHCPAGRCLAPGSAVEVAVAWDMPLPWLPDLVASDRLVIPISAAQRIPVDDYRSSQVAS